VDGDYNHKVTSALQAADVPRRVYLIPIRVLLLTFLMGLLAFAIGLLLGILVAMISAWRHGVHPDMTLAYRYVATPAGACAAAITLVASLWLEMRHFRQTRALMGIEKASRQSDRI